MNRTRPLVIALVMTLAITASGQPGVDANAARQLAGSIVVNGRSFEYVSELTGRFGARLTGSPAYQRAAEWAVTQFRTAGIARAALEPFTIARGWQRGAARGRMVAPLDRPLHLESLGWMPSTRGGGIEGDIAAVRDLEPERIAADPSLRGRIALVGTTGDSGDPAERLKLRDLDTRLREAGAIAVLWPDDAPNNVLSARSPGFGTEVGVLPSAQVGREDVQLIRRLLDTGPVRIAFELHNDASPGPVTVNNVIAEIRGAERPDEWVIVGAHLDSWDFGTGAQDNGTGVAMVLEAARAMAALGRAPRRSIRFALWGGEEQGLVGSMAYVRAHEAELVHCIANINTDGGSGHVRGFLTPGRHDVAEAMRPISQMLLASLGASALDETMRYAFQSDDGAFILNGIPALDLDPDETKYDEVHHKASDTIDKVDRHDLAVGAAAVAIAAFAIADAMQPIAPHLDRSAIAAMLGAARLDHVLRMYGMWKPGS
jgi:hypothetical protein